MSSRADSSSSWLFMMAASMASLASVAVYYYQEGRSHDMAQELERKRQEERTGRIRAEQKVRKLLLLQQQQQQQETTAPEDEYVMKLSCIGKVVSPYTKRMGTPRQGALVPSSRGYIEFFNTLPTQALEGIDEYSHVWVVFQFHVNTSLTTSKKAKVRPPRGGGRKVGQLATRSPHRPNALGLSLVKLQKWDPSTRRLFIQALDLVHGTPVYDIKPLVHWDIPGSLEDKSLVQVPEWVESRDDVLTKVELTSQAQDALKDLIQQDRLAPLYPGSDATSFAAVQQTLKEILAQDPRSSHKGEKNARGTTSEESYKLRFGGTEIEFIVQVNGAKVIGVTAAPLAEDLNGGDDDDDSS